MPVIDTDDDTNAWTNRLVSGIDDRTLPAWARDAMAHGYARSVILVAYLKWEREIAAKVAYT